MHVIQLRGPWEQERSDMPATGRFDWQRDLSGVLASQPEQPVRLLRRFGRPTGIAATDCVRLILHGLAATDVTLNDEPLASFAAPTGELQFEVTDRLAARNVLRMAVTAAAPGAGVRIEISPREE